jgi:metal-sulfur cluster biosynthetic enzyme
MTLRDKIVNRLKTVEDPELKQDVYSLRLVYDIDVDEENKEVKMKFRPTVYNCPIGIQLALSVKLALMPVNELKKIDITVTDFVMAEQANTFLKSFDEELVKKNSNVKGFMNGNEKRK